MFHSEKELSRVLAQLRYSLIDCSYFHLHKKNELLLLLSLSFHLHILFLGLGYLHQSWHRHGIQLTERLGITRQYEIYHWPRSMKRSGPYQERRPPAERAECPPGDVAPGPHSPARSREWVESPVSRVTHIADSARGQFAIPPVFELLDLAV